MELSETQMAFIFAGCVLAIGGLVVALYARGWLNPKASAPAAPVADAAAKPAQQDTMISPSTANAHPREGGRSGVSGEHSAGGARTPLVTSVTPYVVGASGLRLAPVTVRWSLELREMRRSRHQRLRRFRVQSAVAHHSPSPRAATMKTASGRLAVLAFALAGVTALVPVAPAVPAEPVEPVPVPPLSGEERPAPQSLFAGTAIGYVLEANGNEVPKSGEQMMKVLAKFGEVAQLPVTFSAVDLHTSLTSPRVVFTLRPSMITPGTPAPGAAKPAGWPEDLPFPPPVTPGVGPASRAGAALGPPARS